MTKTPVTFNLRPQVKVYISIISGIFISDGLTLVKVKLRFKSNFDKDPVVSQLTFGKPIFPICPISLRAVRTNVFEQHWLPVKT